MTTTDMNTALLSAAKNNDIEQVKQLLDQGADINSRDDYACTPLHIAASQNEDRGFDLLSLLLERGAKVNEKTGDMGETPLAEACCEGNYRCVKQLIQAGADVNAAGEVSPLMNAAINSENWQIVELLLQAGADPNFRSSEDGQTALDWAITDLCVLSFNRGERTVWLLRRYGAIEGLFMERIQPEYHTINHPLLDAIDRHDLNGVREALKAGCDVNAISSAGKNRTALMKAARFGFADIVEELITAGAELRCRDDKGRTALWYAAESNSYETVQHLLRAGLSQADDTASHLHAAVNFGTPESLRAYLDAGYEVNIEEKDATPLDEAFRYNEEGTGYPRCIDLLRQHGGKRHIELSRPTRRTSLPSPHS